MVYVACKCSGSIDFSKFLAQIDSPLGGFSFLRLFIRQVEAIKFAIEWRRKGTTRGGKSYKTDFLLKAFRQDSTYVDVRPDSQMDTQAAYKKALKNFKSQHMKTITARNYLLRLYENVS